MLYWVNARAGFRPAGGLPGRCELRRRPAWLAPSSSQYKPEGINIVAPPTFALLALDANNNIVPSDYARNARAAGLDIITWTLERSGILADGDNGFYYQTFDAAIRREGDVMRVLDVLARQVGMLGVFSDWPATATFTPTA